MSTTLGEVMKLAMSAGVASLADERDTLRKQRNDAQRERDLLAAALARIIALASKEDAHRRTDEIARLADGALSDSLPVYGAHVVPPHQATTLGTDDFLITASAKGSRAILVSVRVLP
jgi:hypothetical protein